MKDRRINRPVLKLAMVIYPIAVAAVAVNLFMLNLLMTFFQIPVIAPVNAILVSVPIAIPVSWLFSTWIRSLISQAENSN